MRDCIKVKIEEDSVRVFNDVSEKGMRIYSHNEQDREGYCYTTIVSYDKNLFELKDCCGTKTVYLIVTMS